MSKANRLVNELSPYLLQHAYNPVDWFPWSEKAFEKAREENKPIFLSIGYSTCHWCHVMEKESFEDEDVAKLMNDSFVSIKVDREERPDIDGIYMTVCQMLTGSGGWPLTVVMTPDKKPFFAGTYFPKVSRYGRIGMLELIPKLKDFWLSKYEEILNSAEEISTALISSTINQSDEMLSTKILDEAFDELIRRFDSEKGGFGKSPKFPTPHNFTFLLRYWKRTKGERALAMVEKTLQEMYYGGIYDHIGFGFHRYSTDQNWLVPHFEKMLYDQALLAIAYTEAYQATKNNLYEQAAKEILEYVSRDMKSIKGGFYSAEDADSDGEEGKFYLWAVDEIKEILNEDAQLFLDYYNLEKDENWIDPVHGGKVGTNILHITKSKAEICQKYQLSINELEIKLNLAQKNLLAYREKRVRPMRDDKILTDWNSLMISAFSKAAQVFNEKKYAEIAQSAVTFILEKLITPGGRLLHRYRNGRADILANLDDYAFFISALMDFYETVFDVEYLGKAIKFQYDVINYFWDEKESGFYFSASDSEKLLIRKKEIYDGAIPSGNSVSLYNLIRLYKFTGNTGYEEKAAKIIKTFSGVIKKSPSAFTHFLSGLDFYFGPSREIIITGSRDEEIKEFLSILNEEYSPNKVIIVKKEAMKHILSQIAGFTENYSAVDGKTSVYLCENFKCRLPIVSFEEFKNQVR